MAAIGISLLLPLTLHMPIAVWFEGVRGFHDWVKVSLVITGPAHVALAWMSARRAFVLVDGGVPQSMRSILVWTVSVAAVPFVIFWAIPPILVAITGIPVVGVLKLMDSIMRKERSALAE